MKTSRFNEEQIIGLIKQTEADLHIKELAAGRCARTGSSAHD